MKDVPFTGEGILNMNSLISAVSAPILLKEDPLPVGSWPSDMLGFFQRSMEKIRRLSMPKPTEWNRET